MTLTHEDRLSPLGLMPKKINQAKRLTEISEAIQRYCIAELKIPIIWIEEYNDLLGRSK